MKQVAEPGLLSGRIEASVAGGEDLAARVCVLGERPLGPLIDKVPE
jgi:hypothetical protein